MALFAPFFIEIGMNQIKVRINGRGNAWPVMLGQDHPFYDCTKYEDLANASCSIIKTAEKQPEEKDIEWDLMIDAGHGAVQYMLKNCNRIPEALFITHPHIDHTLGMDWIVQSFYKLNKKPYPVYATVLCWEMVKTTFPHLKEMIEFKELIPYQKKTIDEVSGVELIPYPVYHGKSAEGATMLFFTINDEKSQKKILFTGDILCPLLRDEDYHTITNIDLLVADANNRYPYPNCNHWSILKGINDQTSEILKNFIDKNTIRLFLYPHLNHNVSNSYYRCFDYFLNKEIHLKNFSFTLSSFIKLIKPEKTVLMHYSGSEDEKYYNQPRLNSGELKDWLKLISFRLNINLTFIIPETGDLIFC
jgi:phosphoribosyl 1,2-cyclic phosphodiesterase